MLNQNMNHAIALIHISILQRQIILPDALHKSSDCERVQYNTGDGDRRLYRSTPRTFEEYCRDRFGYSRRQPYLYNCLEMQQGHIKLEPAAMAERATPAKIIEVDFRCCVELRI
ncbi:MAG: hypothetical protein V7L29_30075 [Nostoc sp.]|uniref:hypothetical protein n=1 Tax=Nostoc sp. TaxID=1180 RepID=UPI002FF7C39A